MSTSTIPSCVISRERTDHGRILIVDDEEDIRVLLELALKRQGYGVYTASGAPEAIDQLERGQFDIVLTDIKMPGMDGIELMTWIRRNAPDTDVIIMTGHASIETATKALRLGAFDYLLKPFPDVELVSSTVGRAAQKQKLEAELRRTTEALRKSQESFANIVEKNTGSILVVDGENRVLYANLAAERLLGRTREDLTGETLGLPVVVGDVTEADIADLTEEKKPVELQVDTTQWESNPAFLVMLRDITERKKLQASLAQASKMGAIGQLAGGIAHEINNPISVILGFAQGIERRVAEDHPLRLPVVSIAREAHRCKDLIQELLTFARTAKKTVEAVDLNNLVRSSAILLQARAKIQNVRLVQELTEKTPVVDGNRIQLQQVLVNLGNNALDAMSLGGVLSLSTRCNGQGDVYLDVADTGSGIPEEIRPRIFEPFFTTKEVGKGTGLGLGLVYEIVQQHGGSIDVRSEPGKGTMISVHLPTQGRPAEKEDAP